MRIAVPIYVYRAALCWPRVLVRAALLACAAAAASTAEGPRYCAGMAGVSCCCGECEIRFVGCTTARLRVECCCCDCRRAALWCAQHGGTVCQTVPCDLTYWPNDLEVVKGADQLEACALNSAWRSCRLISTCCSTPLLVDHPSYKGTVVMAYKETLVDADLPAPAFRDDVRDLTEEMAAALPAASCPVLSPPGSDQYDADQEVSDAAFGAATGPPPTGAPPTISADAKQHNSSTHNHSR